MNFTDVDATTGMLTAYERDRKDKVWKGVSLKQNYIACKFIVNIGLLDPYWQILENSSRNFSEISVYRGVTQTDFWKTHPVFFSKFQFPGHKLDRFLENSSI